MLGFVSRFVGLWCVAGALVALVIDAAKSIAVSSLVVTSVGGTLSALAPSVLAAAQASIDHHVGSWFWSGVVQWLLLLPTWLVLGFLGFLLTYIGRRRRVRLAYA